MVPQPARTRSLRTALPLAAPFALLVALALFACNRAAGPCVPPGPAGAGSAPARASAVEPAPPGAREVHTQLVRDARGGCRYTARVDGTLLRLPEAGPDEEAVYRPRLTVSAEVSCPSGVLHHADPSTVEGPRFARSDLEESLDAEGRVNADAAGQVCAYQPHFSVESDTVVARDLAESCRAEPAVVP